MVASRKDTRHKSIRKNNNYECRVRKCKGEDEVERQQFVKRKSYLFDRFSSESQQVERRKRTTSNSVDQASNRNRPVSLTINGIQEICMVDIKTQLAELTKKVIKLTETTETRLKLIESKLDQRQPP